jgi:hypothetical protein
MRVKDYQKKLETDRYKNDKREWTLVICGKRLTLHRLGYKPFKKPYNSRGPITTFSRKARARMLRKIAEIDWQSAGPGLFLTVTYPDECAQHTMQERSCHRYLLHRWIENQLGGHVACVWRVEWMPRKTGTMVGQMLPHIHLLLFTPKGLDTEEVRRKWMSIIGSTRHTQIDLQRVELGSMVSVYAAKYCSKVADASILDNVPKRNRTGRHAGWLRTKLIPVHPKEVYERVGKAIVLALRKRACETLWWYDPRFDEGFTILGDTAIEVIREFYGMRLDDMGEFVYDPR